MPAEKLLKGLNNRARGVRGSIGIAPGGLYNRQHGLPERPTWDLGCTTGQSNESFVCSCVPTVRDSGGCPRSLPS